MAMRSCLDCGFEPEAVRPGDIPGLIRSLGRTHQAWLTGFEDPAPLSGRPPDGTWSPLEYGGHLRDVLWLFDRRVRSILRAPGGDLELVDHEAAVAHGRYDQLPPGPLGAEIVRGADRLAATLERVRPSEWSLGGLRHGDPRTIAEIGLRAVHEGRHHLLDVRRILDQRP